MDSFFAAVEERDNPTLKGKPVAVGGDADRRGVICTANYVARTFGVRSAMATAKAVRLCPDLILLHPDMQKYKVVSQNIRAIFQQYTSLVEPLSLDEAFLDVSECAQCYGSATWMAQEIRKKIYATENLTASAGVSVNKFLAKVASDWNKPNGQHVVPPEAVEEFIAALPVTKIFGVGPKAAEKLRKLGITTCRELQGLTELELTRHFGKNFGFSLFNLARGIDARAVNPNRIRKSLSVEETFLVDLSTIAQCQKELATLLVELQRRLAKHYTKHSNNGYKQFRKIFVKIKFADFTHTTVENIAETLTIEQLNSLLDEGFSRGGGKAIRLLGVGVRFADLLSEQIVLPTKQLDLFLL